MANLQRGIWMMMAFIPVVIWSGCASSGYDSGGYEPEPEYAVENVETFVPYITLELSEHDWSTTAWLESLRQEIFDQWISPDDYQPSFAPGYTVVTFAVTPDGTIHDIQMQERYGQPELHTEALMCIESIGSPRPLPADFRHEKLEVEVKFKYESSDPVIIY